MWSGKSSHIKVIFDSSTFDFNNTINQDASGAQAIFQGSRTLKEHVPANIVPDVAIVASGNDDYVVSAANHALSADVADMLVDRFETYAGYGAVQSDADTGNPSVHTSSLGTGAGRFGLSGVDLVTVLGTNTFNRTEASGANLCGDAITNQNVDSTTKGDGKRYALADGF